MDRREVTVVVLTIILMAVFSFAILYKLGGNNLSGMITGFAVFSQDSQAGFDEGSYSNVGWNGSDVVLSSSQTSGTYTSKVFDAGNDAYWNSITETSITPDVDFLYGVDGGGDVYVSSDSGLTWNLKKEDYGRTSDTVEMFSDSDYLYILSSSNREVFRSGDLGVSWSIVNNDFADSGVLAGEKDSSGNLYAVDASGDVYISINDGVTWILQGDFNAEATNNAKGFGISLSGVLYIVDGSGSVFKSVDSGVTWTEQSSGYGGGAGTDDLEIDSSGNLYILNNDQIYKSSDEGETWNKISDDFSPYSNDGCKMFIEDNDNFYIADCSGRVFSSGDGITWIELGDLNGGASNDIKGLTNFFQSTSLTFQVRACSNSDCSDGEWEDVDLNDLSLQSRYFQYKVSFLSPDSSVTPILESMSVDYDLVNTAPSLSLVLPQDGDAYGYDEGIVLDFSVSDADDNLDSCWYTLDAGENNISLVDCTDTTFDVAENGEYNLVIYAKDILGLESSDSASFSVAIGAPTISLNSPVDAYLSSQEVTFIYIPTDLDLDSCELWGNFTGDWERNQTDISPESGVQNSFLLTLEEGGYLWNVKCNDTLGNSATNGNQSFYIDISNPQISITEPSGTKSSRTGIPLQFSISDLTSTTCLYNVYRGSSVEVSNTTISDCASTSFSVTVDADFVLNLYVEDSVGNENSTSTSFSVNTALPGGDTGGGGGGGSSTVIIPPSEEKFDVELIEGTGDIIVYPGDEKTLAISVKNTGNQFLNKCKLTGDCESNDLKNIDVGEISEFVFTLSVPASGDYSPKIKLECVEKTLNINLDVTLINSNSNIEISKISLEGNNLIVDYISKFSDSVDLEFAILNNLGGKIVKQTELASPGANSFEFDISSAEKGMLKLAVYIPGQKTVLVEESFIYSSGGITGFVFRDILGDGGYTIGVGAIVIVFLIIGFFMVRRIFRLRKKRKR